MMLGALAALLWSTLREIPVVPAPGPEAKDGRRRPDRAAGRGG
jgi:hypothetical protein